MLYAAYEGDTSNKQVAIKCPNSNIVCDGKLKGWKLVSDGYLNIVKTNKDNDEVPVVVWNILDEDWYKLDKYRNTLHYTKKITNVVMGNNEVKKAIVYVFYK